MGNPFLSDMGSFIGSRITNIKYQKKSYEPKTAAIGKESCRESTCIERKKALLRYEEVYFFASWLYYLLVKAKVKVKVKEKKVSTLR